MSTNVRVQARASAQALQPARASRILRGFGNILHKELDDWFAGRRWLTRLIVWVAIVDVSTIGLLLLTAQATAVGNARAAARLPVPEPSELGITMLLPLGTLAGAIAAIIVALDAIIGEKQSGTAAWILSKPASRAAFVLSKLAADGIGMLVFVVVVPGIVGGLAVWLITGKAVDWLAFLAGFGVEALALAFYLTLTIMLGVLLRTRGQVLGLAFAILFGPELVFSFLPQISLVLPVQLRNLAAAFALGKPLPAAAVLPIVCAAVWSVLFTAVAMWRFEHQEL